MELKPGYKQTEIGVVPDDWEVLPAAQVGRFRGGTGFPLSYQGLQEGAFPFYKVSDMNNEGNEKFMVAANNWISEETRQHLGAQAFPMGSIVFAKVGAAVFLERKKILSMPSCLDNNMAAFVLDEERACVQFVHAQLIDRKLGDLVATTALPSLSGKVLGEMTLALPSLLEQSAIATALGDVDALLAAQDALIEKKRVVKQGVTQELLTGKRRLPGFDTGWRSHRLGELAKIQRGASPRPIDSPHWFDEKSKVGWVRISDVTNSGMYLEETTQSLSQEGIRHSRLVPTGSLIMSICATVGRPIITKIDTCIHDGFVVFDDVRADRKFLYYVLKWIEPNWSKRGQTGSQMNLNTGLISATEVTLPAAEEQAAIAEALSEMDAEITALEAKREKTALLKQGMMQELLTGKTRLLTPAVQRAESSANIIPFKTKQDNSKGDAIAVKESGTRQANVYFKRSVFAAEIVDQLHNEPTFGHVKFEKLIFLAEHLCKVDTGSNYHRDAAGPYDNRALRSIDSQLKKQKWFDAQKNGGRFQYVPLDKHGGHKDYFDRYYADIRARLDEIISIFRTAKTDQCEIVATLYGAWNDLFNSGATVTDEAILDQVLNHWHDKKRNISEERWRKALGWMREKGYVPGTVA